MAIGRIETFLVPPRWLFVRIETEDGLVGWGEPIVEGHAEVVRVAVAEFAELLLGTDEGRIEHHWLAMTKGGFYRGGPVFNSAAAGVDQALWDIAGKRLGRPVHELLGGAVRDRVRAYAWVGGDEPEALADDIERRIAAGMTAVKMNASGRMPPLAALAETRAIVERAQVARDVLGPGRDFALDFHGRLTLADSRRVVPLLEPLHPLFVEEPVVPEASAQLHRVVDATTVPIATGERLYSRQEFLPVLQQGVAVVQPDVCHAGGISETRRIAALAETFDARIAPHCPLGPIALAASLQIGFASPNLLIQEHGMGIHYNGDADLLDYVVDRSPFALVDGSFDRFVGAGLGVEIDETAVRDADRRGHAWRSPRWHHADGGFAEW
ncbi:D-galactonate dehydratase [Agromyces sp. Root81]|uniref:galactonate dehydratase n=1 Tax=Agromyces sp. Root81 TaxID=1736601 RepID=UPI0006FF4670|nr:galactonate dehydratase [Agromyces sp. Root81]KRC62577.1 D-galactonate dehydratase [Agromyces sp. Root81]